MEDDMNEEILTNFCECSGLENLLKLHQNLCDIIGVSSTYMNDFFPSLKAKFACRKWKSLWKPFDKKAATACYNGGLECSATKVLVVGAGPVGLRAAIEAQFLGAKVVVMEMRETISKHNVLPLWQFVIEDLLSLNAKKFYAKFGADGRDHISIQQLQLILLKVALIIGVEVHVGVTYDGLNSPEEASVGWRAIIKPPDHTLCHYEFDVLIGANGKYHTLQGFTKKRIYRQPSFTITANFLNNHTPAEDECPEITADASLFKEEILWKLKQETGATLKNIVYFNDDTHSFTITASKECLLKMKILGNDDPDPVRLLSADNRDVNALQQFALEVCRHCTENKLPNMQFALTHHGEKDVDLFDLTHMKRAEHSCRVDERHGRRLLQMLVGDSLLEPFWLTGSGSACGLLSAMDAAWTIMSWKHGQADPLTVIAERESVFRALHRADRRNIYYQHDAHTIDPTTRYKFLNVKLVEPHDVQALYMKDNPERPEQGAPASPDVSLPVDTDRSREDADTADNECPRDQVTPDGKITLGKRSATNGELNNLTASTSNIYYEPARKLAKDIKEHQPHLSRYGTNFLNVNPAPLPTEGLRPIIIDSCNVGRTHGGGHSFSSRGLYICVRFFRLRHHQVYAILPEYILDCSRTIEPEILRQLKRDDYLRFTPSRLIDGKARNPYDDRYMVQIAAELGGIIVTNDQYRDIAGENPYWSDVIKNRLLPFVFITPTMIMFAQDPHGPHLKVDLNSFLKF